MKDEGDLILLAIVAVLVLVARLGEGTLPGLVAGGCAFWLAMLSAVNAWSRGD